tara:strand:+ start:1329 stop:3494 length:2166 start_codon:yes stop_codon:yes gene_type:complete
MTTDINQEVKGTLARLLATENLTVEHRKVSTAFFDVEKRLLCLPIWKTASNTVYDLLVGHEVGHALYTPNARPDGVNKSFLNVLEDVRIEKLMRQTYPGLKKTFFAGYAELWRDDFFGVANDDINELAFIDRINLFYKGCYDMEFTAEEQVYVNRAGATKTFEEVIELAKELYDLMEEKEQEKLEELSQEQEQQDLEITDDERELTPTNEETPSDSDEIESDKSPKSAQELSDEIDEALDELMSGKYGSDEGTVNETEAMTDKAFQKACEQLIDEDAKEWVYLDLPKLDLDKYIKPAKEIKDELFYWFNGQAHSSEGAQERHMENLDNAIKKYFAFKKSSNKTVNYLVKQFEMKKSAENYKRAATAKTGVIDTNSLHKYKLTEDIFKKITVVPDGKNHGLVMYLDWSGSMSWTLLDTLKQVYNLVWFCKKVNIPFRVYGFASGYYGRYGSHSNIHECMVNPDNNTLAIGDDIRLLEFLSSQQRTKELEESMKYLFLQASSFHNSYLQYYTPLGLGGTPLAEALYAARQLVDRLKAQEKVSKVNVICLTDGESQPMSYIHKSEYEYNHGELTSRCLASQYGKLFFLRDKQTGYTKKITNTSYNTTAQIVGFLREITNYNWVGIRLCSKGEANRMFREYSLDKYEKLDKQWRKERFASIKNDCGFTEAFFMPDRGNGEDTQDLEVKQKGEVATRAELGRAFKKHMNSKMTNKTVLNRFIDQIA